MITEDYVSLEVAKLLKEKGFDEPCDFVYDKDKLEWIYHMFIFLDGKISTNSEFRDSEIMSAPTLQMAIKWLREVHDIFIEIMIFDEEDRIGLSEDERYCWNIHYNSTGNIRPFDGTAKTPEEACEAGIKYCLENLI